MDVPPPTAQGAQFADFSFLDSNFDQSQTMPGPSSQNDMQTIDFSASQAYFSGLESSRSPVHIGSPSHAGVCNHGRDTSSMSPNSAISGLDPVSKLGFTSNRAFMRLHSGASGSGDTGVPYSSHQPSSGFSQPNIPIKPAFAPQSPERMPRSEAEASTSTHQQRNQEAAHRTAEVERRNRLREEEKVRRKLAIQKQVDDGMAALRLEKDGAAQRSAEVERRNKLREEKKTKARLAIQKQVEDGIKAIQLEKERERARVEQDRTACRKWLSDLSHAAASSSSAAVDATIDVYVALGRQLRGFWEDSRPAASSQAQRNEVISDIQCAITRKWPDQGLQVAAFGSSVTGLVTKSSDLDLVLLDPTRPYGVGTPPELRRDPNNFVRHSGGMPEWYSTHQIANAVRASNKFRSVVSIGGASVPIVKMIHRKHDIPADININERFGLFNSQLISAYANLQPDLVRPLIFFLKHWYSRRELNDPAGKRGSMTFSSYTIALMALQVLQVEGVLPNLQSPDLLNSLHIRPNFLYSRIKRPRRGNKGRLASAEDVAVPQKYNVTFAASQVDAESYRRKALKVAGGGEYSKDRLLGKMLASFVRFYQQLDRHTQIVSIVNGSPLQRRKKSQSRHVFFDSASEDGFSELNGDAAEHTTESLQRTSRDVEGRAALRGEQADVWAGDELVVQDPFIIDRNTSRNIKSRAVERWQSEMEMAIHVLGLDKAGETSRVRLEDTPLIFDLCIPQNLISGTEADGHGTRASATETAPEEPRRPEEEAEAQAREMAKQAAQNLGQEKKKRARRSKRSEARLLQEEAVMVEDMIGGIETGQVTGLMSGNERHEIWRLRTNNDLSNGGNSTAIPFTFSVARTHTPKKTDPVMNVDVTLSPKTSITTTRTNAPSSSEDIDLVALRLERDVRV